MPVLPSRESLQVRIAFCILSGVVASPVAFGQRELTDIPDPDPVAERAAMQVHDQAEVNLFAADPDLRKPIQVNFDCTGGLWIASSEVYPQIRPGEVANDKIIVLRDTDGDGVSDSRTVFADGLLIPTGVLPDGPHAAYVAESTRLLYLQDTDGDGVADKQRVILSGFGTEDTHHLVHTLRFGPDGCVYFNQSIYIHSHIQTPDGTQRLDGGGIWRYRPETGKLEIFCKGFVNPWGHTFDAVGESFATDGAFFEGINYVFPDSIFVTSPGATRWLKGLNPGSPKHCGLEVLSGTHIPEDWAGQLVTNDFRSHRVCRFTVQPSASGYISRQLPELILSSHVAFRPIDVRMGPDGAVYVADWYNPIIQHGEVDFRDERRDREHGRIWRISFPQRDADRWPDFANATTEQLIQWLEDPSLAVRQFARQELWKHVKENQSDVMSKIQQWADENPSQRQLEVVWLNEVADDIAPPSEVSLASIDPVAQRTYLRSVWRNRLDADEETRRQIETQTLALTTHEDPRVRLEAVVCAGQLDADQYPAAIQAVLAATEHPIDDNLDFAIWQSIRKLNDSSSESTVLATISWADRLDQLAFAVRTIETPAATAVALSQLQQAGSSSPQSVALVDAIARTGDAEQLGQTVKLLASDADDALFDAAKIDPLLARTQRDATIPKDVGPTLAQRAADVAASDDAQMQTLARMASTWKTQSLQEKLLAALPESQDATRERIIESIGAFSTPEAKQALSKLAESEDAATRVAATAAIASQRPAEAITPILKLIDQPQTFDAGADLLVRQLRRQQMPGRIAAALKDRALPTDRARQLLQRVRSAGGNAPLEQAIQAAGNLSDAGWKLTPQLQAEILQRVASEGSAERGEDIYRREQLQCIQCHAIGVGGGVVGPNLISLGGSSQPDYILESLLDPSAKLKEGFTTLSVLTDSGEIINGVAIGGDDESVRLRLADGKEVEIENDTIEATKPGKSLMPDGLLDQLTKAELVDLTTFMTKLGKDPQYTVSTRPLVRSLETLIYSDEANHRLNRTSTDTAASDDEAMKWRPITTRVNGSIPLDELDVFKQHRQTPETSFVRFQVSLPESGIAQIEMPTQGIEAWVNGRPTPVWDLKSLQLEAGEHTIVLALDRTQQQQPLQIEVQGDAVPVAAAVVLTADGR